MKLTGALRKAAGAALRGSKGARLQVGALPYRRKADGSTEVLLVTTRGTGQWMIPKGWPMRGKSAREAAAQEAWEEAGVRGTTGKREIGRFRHDKSDWLRGSVPCVIAVYPLAVTQEAELWPEHGQRSRGWFSLDDASARVRSPALAVMIAGAGTL